MDMIGVVGRALQRVLGPSLDGLGREVGVVKRHRKFTGSTLVKTLVLTLLRAPRAGLGDYCATAVAVGVDVTPRGVEKRFTSQLVGLLRRVVEQAVGEVVTANPAVAPLLARFSRVDLGDGSTVPLPDEAADEFPGCGGASGSGEAAVKLQVLWDFRGGGLLRLVPEPGRLHDTNSVVLEETPPKGSLVIRDLGYFDLSRFRAWGAADVCWISRWQPGTRVFEPAGRPLDLLRRLQSLPAGVPFDAAVLMGAEERLPCRLIALRVPQEAADQRRRKAYDQARKHGRVPSREHLAWCDWTLYITNCPVDLLTWKEVVVLYRTRWQIELLFKLWKSHNGLATPPATASPQRREAEFWAKLIGVVVQHWLLLTTAWPDARRSLWKAARAIRHWMLPLTEALDHPHRLRSVLRSMRTIVATLARVERRKKHPSLFQLLLNPELLDWNP